MATRNSPVIRWLRSSSEFTRRMLSTSESSSATATAAAKDYEEYRRALYGGITHKALLVDAVGTLVVPAQPMAQIYKTIGEKYGVEYSEKEILDRYRWAYEKPWGRSSLRLIQKCATRPLPPHARHCP